MNNKSLKLGGGTVEQVSLNVEINIEKILNLFLKNIKFIKEVLIKEDEYAKELFEHLEKKKKLIFPINKHIELFILGNKSNIKKITKYIIFRYKFFLAGKKKVNLGYPPYLLIEPVSVCNLRCPFCFQTDKTFTKKPFMGVMDGSSESHKENLAKLMLRNYEPSDDMFPTYHLPKLQRAAQEKFSNLLNQHVAG